MEVEKEEASDCHIEFRNVWFSYPSRQEWVLHDFSLKIYKNETVGFVGNSGCGKSTLTQLILRFYDPQKGQILIDEKTSDP